MAGYHDRSAPPVPGQFISGTGHACPVRGCDARVAPDRLMCLPHWYTVPRVVRARLWAAWDTGSGAGSIAHRNAVQAAVDAANRYAAGIR